MLRVLVTTPSAAIQTVLRRQRVKQCENSVTSAPDASPGYRMRHPTAAASSDADTRSQVVKVATALGCTLAPMIGGAG